MVKITNLRELHNKMLNEEKVVMNLLHAEVIKRKDGVISLAGLNVHYSYK